VNIEYILDASGSMLEIMGNEAKIDIAKKTLTKLMESLPADAAEVNLNVGLRIYGHTVLGKDDPEAACKDTILEMPIKGVDVQGMKSKIEGIKARGRTPIAYSLQEARSDFPPAAGADNIIILVSDGQETCGGDPCAAARELHEAGIKVKIHVVGFDIKPAEKSQLECIAKAAGGKYFAADSAEGLTKALTEAKEQVLKKESESVVITAAGPGKLRVETAEWVGGAPYYFKVKSAADGKEVTRSIGKLEDLTLPAGEYTIVWRQWEHGSSDVDLGERFTVKSGETTSLSLATGIHLVPAKWLEEAPYYWKLREARTGKEVLRVNGKWDAVLAPPGAYELWYRQWEHGSSEVCLSKEVEIKKGSCTEVDLNTGMGIKPADPKAAKPYRWVLADKATGKAVVTVNEHWGPIPVPPGRYKLSLQQTEHGHSLTEIVSDLEVRQGQLIHLEL
jgi:hypothetical protein